MFNTLELHLTTLCYCSSVNTRNHVMQCIRLGKSPDKKVSRSQAVMPDLMIWKQISLSHDKDDV